MSRGRESEFVGTLALSRFAARRDFGRIAAWIAAIVVLVLVSAGSVKGVYPTQHDLDVAAAASQDNPAAIAFNGPPLALDTLGGQVAFQLSSFGLLTAALMSVLMMTRLTRGEEDAGRLELIRSMSVGRHAPLASSAVVVVGMNFVLGALVTVTLLGVGLPTSGSIVFGAAFAVVGAVFTAVAGLLAQVFDNPRVAAGTAGGVLGVAFVLRAVGDIGDGTLSWFSPIGWGQKARPYAGDQWWPLIVASAIAIATGTLGFMLATRRDFGGGLIGQRSGHAEAAPSLGSPLGLTVRLLRATVLWWTFAIAVLGVTYGSLANSIQDFVKDNETVADLLARAGGASLVDSYLSTSLLVTALIGTSCAIQAVLRLRTEEIASRAEPILATPASRGRWTGAHVAVAITGLVVILIANGAGMGVTYGIAIGDASQVPRLTVAALTYLPAGAVLVGLAMAVFGVVPRWTMVAWLALGACFVIAMFEPLLGLPGWVATLSPFESTPLVPAADADPVPLAVLTAVAVALFTAGFVGFRRRDVG